jgi:hypothetical protein
VLPAELERRVTFPDVLKGISDQTQDAASGAWMESDFAPLPCAHPNAHSLAYAYRRDGACLPLARFVDLDSHIDLLAGRITFNRDRARQLVSEYLSRLTCGSAECGCADASQFVDLMSTNGRPAVGKGSAASGGAIALGALPEEFFHRAMAEELGPEDVFRITTTSFMDAYNFDVRQEMKACVHFVLPSGHVVPFSAYNLLYRDGLAPLPILERSFVSLSAAVS